ncbi:MAG TPA: hypothetical protein VGE30_01360 [Candidatus Saccharimonadales bacterium]
MRWFEMGYDRGNVANTIMAATDVEPVCPGFDRTKFVVEKLATTCYLSRYLKRQVYDAHEGTWVPMDLPFYMLQIEYDAPDGVRVNARVEFDDQHSMLKRSSDYQRFDVANNPDHAPRIWDEAMAATDEAFYAHAQHLGIILGARMVERRSELAPVYPPYLTAVA